MPSIKDVLADYQAQIERARDRIRMFESGEISAGGTFAPSEDWTSEAIAIEQKIIKSLEFGIEILTNIDTKKP